MHARELERKEGLGVNLYDTIGVDESATQEEIKRAYREKAMNMHPDQGGVKDLSTAYSVLSNAEKRKRYDETGETEQAPISRPFSIAVTIFVEVVEQEPSNLTNAITKYVQAKREHIEQEILAGKNGLKKVDSFLDRIIERPENDFITYEMTKRRNAINQMIEHKKGDLKELNEAAELLKTYVFKDEEEKVQMWGLGAMQFNYDASTRGSW
jgi:curved DNA-binding protein CbpA